MIIVDTSGVLASKDEAHPEHEAVAKVLRETADDLVVSPFVVAECDYMLATRLGYDAAREFLEEVAAGAYLLDELDSGDVASANGIIDRYGDLHMGIADASQVVLAARHETTHLLTFDHRHFRAVAPLWGAPAFRLLPADV